MRRSCRAPTRRVRPGWLLEFRFHDQRRATRELTTDRVRSPATRRAALQDCSDAAPSTATRPRGSCRQRGAGVASAHGVTTRITRFSRGCSSRPGPGAPAMRRGSGRPRATSGAFPGTFVGRPLLCRRSRQRGVIFGKASCDALTGLCRPVLRSSSL